MLSSRQRRKLGTRIYGRCALGRHVCTHACVAAMLLSSRAHTAVAHAADVRKWQVVALQVYLACFFDYGVYLHAHINFAGPTPTDAISRTRCHSLVDCRLVVGAGCALNLWSGEAPTG